MKNNTKLSLTILRSIQIIGIVLIALLHLLDSWVLKDRSEDFFTILPTIFGFDIIDILTSISSNNFRI